MRVLRFITKTPIEEGILSRAAYKNDLDNKIIEAGMFNNSATEAESRQRLEDLIKVKNDEQSDDENEIPDDAELNEMIARSEEELKEFNLMDQ